MQPQQISDLVERARSGDSVAWNAIVEEFANVVWATVRRFRFAEPEAADAVQTTWLRLIEHLDAIKDAERIAGWLSTTARRVCLELLRDSARVIPVDPHDDPRLESAGGSRNDECTPETVVLVQQDIALVRAALATLEERDRTLLTLLTSPQEISYREISARMSIPIGSVGPTRGRALDRLRVALESVGVHGMAR